MTEVMDCLTTTALDPAALSDWCAHTAHGHSAADLARSRGLHRATIHRRLAAFEALADCAAWAAILGHLTDATAEGLLSPVDGAIGPAAQLHVATGRTTTEALVALRRHAAPLTAGGAAVFAPGNARAALVGTDRNLLASVPAPDVLAWVLMGWVADPTPNGRIATLHLTAAGQSAITLPSSGPRRRGPSADAVSRVRRWRSSGTMSPAHARLAARIAADFNVDPAACRAVLARALAPLTPPRVDLALDLFARPVTVAAAEIAAGLPPRSGPVVGALLLDVIAASGVFAPG